MGKRSTILSRNFRRTNGNQTHARAQSIGRIIFVPKDKPRTEKITKYASAFVAKIRSHFGQIMTNEMTMMNFLRWFPANSFHANERVPHLDERTPRVPKSQTRRTARLHTQTTQSHTSTTLAHTHGNTHTHGIWNRETASESKIDRLNQIENRKFSTPVGCRVVYAFVVLSFLYEICWRTVRFILAYDARM